VVAALLGNQDTHYPNHPTDCFRVIALGELLNQQLQILAVFDEAPAFVLDLPDGYDAWWIAVDVCSLTTRGDAP
jgi:hypothetical protein